MARALYYTPTVAGLQSFQCRVSVDWKDLIERFGGKDIADDNPLLQYLNSVEMTATDEFALGGKVDWIDTKDVPASLNDARNQIRDGSKQGLEGFLTAWNGYMNGSMVPVPDKTVTFTPTANGWTRLRAVVSGGTSVDEVYDSNMLLTQAHVLSPAMDVVAVPTYADSADGRIVSSIKSTVRQPPTAPPAEITMSTTYAPVSSFQLPQTVTLEVKNVGSFKFKFSGCSVHLSEKSASRAK